MYMIDPGARHKVMLRKLNFIVTSANHTGRLGTLTGALGRERRCRKGQGPAPPYDFGANGPNTPISERSLADPNRSYRAHAYSTTSFSTRGFCCLSSSSLR